jgi:hypothetical protein
MRYICTSIMAFASLCITGTSFGDFWKPTPVKLTASDGEMGDRFGKIVAIDGDTCLIGASNAAYVYTSNGSHVAKLTADSDAFGSSVAIDAGIAVIGAWGDDDNGIFSGSAYVFEQQADGTWQQAAKLTADDGAQSDYFGNRVALDAGIAVIGADGDDDNGSGSGSAYVFEQQADGTWQQIAKLTADDGAAGDFFGNRVALDAGVAVIGAYYDEFGTGSAYVFEQQVDGTWQQITKITADDGSSGDAFGSSVALDAGVAVIGADGDDDNGSGSGSAYVYEQQANGTWQQIAKLTADDGASGDGFGESVALDAGVAVIGADGDDDNGNLSGSAYVFEQQGDGTWQQITKITADDGADFDYFGRSVATSGGIAVIGAEGNNSSPGSAYVYGSNAATGACCVTSGCDSLTEASCTSLGGTWLGEGSLCDDCPASCAGDITGDGHLGIQDLLLMLEAWGPCP